LTPGVNTVKLFSLQLTNKPNKLEYMFDAKLIDRRTYDRQ